MIQYWSYRQVLDKLYQLSEIEGFEIHLVDPAYTSQTCSNCGVIDKSNRKSEVYQCHLVDWLWMLITMRP